MIYFPGLKVSSAKQQCKLLLPHSCCPEQGEERGGGRIGEGGREAETERGRDIKGKRESEKKGEEERKRGDKKEKEKGREGIRDGERVRER